MNRGQQLHRRAGGPAFASSSSCTRLSVFVRVRCFLRSLCPTVRQENGTNSEFVPGDQRESGGCGFPAGKYGCESAESEESEARGFGRSGNCDCTRASSNSQSRIVHGAVHSIHARDERRIGGRVSRVNLISVHRYEVAVRQTHVEHAKTGRRVEDDGSQRGRDRSSVEQVCEIRELFGLEQAVSATGVGDRIRELEREGPRVSGRAFGGSGRIRSPRAAAGYAVSFGDTG